MERKVNRFCEAILDPVKPRHTLEVPQEPRLLPCYENDGCSAPKQGKTDGLQPTMPVVVASPNATSLDAGCTMSQASNAMTLVVPSGLHQIHVLIEFNVVGADVHILPV